MPRIDDGLGWVRCRLQLVGMSLGGEVKNDPYPTLGIFSCITGIPHEIEVGFGWIFWIDILPIRIEKELITSGRDLDHVSDRRCGKHGLRFFSGFLTASRLLRKSCGCMHFDLLFDRISNWSVTPATLTANVIYTSYIGSCEKDVKVRIGKAASVFVKMKKKIWSNNNISWKINTRLYQSIILSTLLYSAELWPLTSVLRKRLDAAHQSPHTAKKHIRRLLERQVNKWGDQR